jgi:hypothetical protein
VALSVDVIAERRLELRSSRQTVEVVVKLGRPEPDETYGSWKCQYEVSFGDAITSMAIHGGDALQALQLSMATLDVELKHGAKQRGGILWHLDEPFNSVLENSGLQLCPPQGASK